MNAVILVLSFLMQFAQLANATDKASPKVTVETEKAVFAAGCFWGVEEFFRKIPGVVETSVGYTGGKSKAPRYHDVSSGVTGHAEAVEVQFDPKKVSLEKLFDQFYKMHDPTTLNAQGNDKGTQYRSAFFYNSEEQKKIAEAFKAKVEKSGAWKKPITTEISKAGPYYPAEEEHQDYLIKNKGGYDNHYLREISFDTQKKLKSQ